MYKDIEIKHTKDFAHYSDAVLVGGDENAYRIVFKTPFDLSGCVFKVSCQRADGTVIADIGETDGDTAYYVLASSMYSVPGDMEMRLTLIDGEESIITFCSLGVRAVAGFGEATEEENLVPVLDSVLSSVAEIQGNVEEISDSFESHADAAVLDHPDGSVTSAKIASGAVTSGKIASGAVTSVKIADEAVTSAKIEPQSITWQKMAESSVGEMAIQSEAVTSGKIRDEAVTGAKIKDSNVTTDKIHNDAVTTAKIASGAITGEKIASGAITGEKIASGAITGGKIASDAVTRQKIAQGAVATNAIADGAVDNLKLADGAVTSAKIYNGAIGSAHISNGAIQSDKISNNAVTKQKLSPDLSNMIDTTKRSLDYLWKKAKGIIYDTETVTGNTSVVSVPSGAMEYAEIKKLGGKSTEPDEPTIVNKIISSGKNLFDKSQCLTRVSDHTITPTDDGLIYTGNFYFYLPFNAVINESYVFNANIVSQNPPDNLHTWRFQYLDGTYSYSTSFGAIITAEKATQCVLIYPNASSGDVATTEFSNMQLELGTSATEYKPYKEPTEKAIPSSLITYLSDKAYGMASSLSADRINHIDFENKKYIQWVLSDGTDLEEALEYDISSYLTDEYFNILEVEAGGSISFKDGDGDIITNPVFSETEFMVDVEEV